MSVPIIVTVSRKTSTHPFYGQGSDVGYVINGIPGGTLNLERGKTYTFQINAPGHPFYFTTSPKGGQGMPGSLMNNQKPVAEGTLTFMVRSSLPSSFYYQCAVHDYMGGQVNIINGSNLQQVPLTPQTTPTSIRLIPFYGGFASPLNLLSVGDDIYVGDQIGVIYRIDTNNQNSIFLDLRSRMVPLNTEYDERGLLGLAFSDNRVFVFYSANDNRGAPFHNYVSEFMYFNGKADLSSEKVLLSIPKMVNYHNGGRLTFGPDGYLYIAVGDGGPQMDPYNHAQDLSQLYGKILRIDVSTPGRYKIPPTNPFVNVPNSRPEIYAYGFRNPWSLTFDNQRRLWVGDVGFEQVEEIDIVVKGGNYGWKIKEGTMWSSWDTPQERQRTDLIDPVFDYTHDWINQYSLHPGPSAVIGGYYIPNKGYIFGDYNGVLMVINPINGKWTLTDLTSINPYIKSFGMDGSGNVYVMTSNQAGPTGNTGQISRITF